MSHLLTLPPKHHFLIPPQFAYPIPFRHVVSSSSVFASCSSRASGLRAQSQATNFRRNLIQSLRAQTFAGCNYLLPSSLRPPSCWLTWRRHACTHTYIYSIPISRRSLACATTGSLALDLCCHCFFARLIQLFRALPNFLPICWARYCPHITLTHHAGKEGLAHACMQCLSGLAGLYFCHIEVALVVTSFEYLHNLWRSLFFSISLLCQCPASQ